MSSSNHSLGPPRKDLRDTPYEIDDKESEQDLGENEAQKNEAQKNEAQKNEAREKQAQERYMAIVSKF